MKRKYGRSNINRGIVTPKCQLGDGRRRDDFVNRIVIKPKGGEARARGDRRCKDTGVTFTTAVRHYEGNGYNRSDGK